MSEHLSKDDGLKKTPKQLRPCLCCGHLFRSEGYHNRLCGPCRLGSVTPFDVAYSVLGGTRRKGSE